jgi:hypothetical protein
MNTILHFILLGAIVLVLLAFAFLWVIDLLDKVSTLREYAPWLVAVAEHKKWHGAVLLACLIFLTVDATELYLKEVPEVPSPPNVTLTPPVPPAMTIYQLPRPQKDQCWARSYGFVGDPSSGLTVIVCNAKYDAPFLMTIEYDQKLTRADAILFPAVAGRGIEKADEKVEDNKVTSYFEFPSIHPNEPLTVVVHGSGENFPRVKKVTLRTKSGAAPEFSY